MSTLARLLELQTAISATLGNVAYLLTFFCACLPSAAKYFYMIYRLIFGTLYPTYLSYKALKQKDEKECARMMMYWIVFSIFNFAENFLDFFIGFWFPFYYESKIVFIFWLISPYANGAKILYENVVNQKLEENEEAIDGFIANLKQTSICAFWSLWDRFSIHLNQGFILAMNRAQVLAIHYANNHRLRTNLVALTSGNQVDSFSGSLSDKPDGTEPEDERTPIIHIDSDTEPECKLRSEPKEEDEPVRRPRKTKRKTNTTRQRTVTIEDISSRPLTRAANLKLQSLTTDDEAEVHHA